MINFTPDSSTLSSSSKQHRELGRGIYSQYIRIALCYSFPPYFSPALAWVLYRPQFLSGNIRLLQHESSTDYSVDICSGAIEHLLSETWCSLCSLPLSPPSPPPSHAPALSLHPSPFSACPAFFALSFMFSQRHHQLCWLAQLWLVVEMLPSQLEPVASVTGQPLNSSHLRPSQCPKKMNFRSE